MASTIESMHGILHEVSAKLSSLNSAQGGPRSASSVRKRARHDDSLVEDVQPEITSLQEEAGTIAGNASVASIFNSQFRPSASGYNPATLSPLSTETFIYDWYTKGLGIVKEKDVELNQRCWMSAVGSKVSTDNQGYAKTLMKLVEMVSTKSELDFLKGPKPDAAKDPAYGGWESQCKGICKALPVIMNAFLTMKEGKVGNAKTLTVGAMARRWKMQGFPVPTDSEIHEIKTDIALELNKKRSSSSSNIKAKSTILKASAKVRVSV
jgi:hypothetical protein